MAHLALYRKYRSQTFDELVGQEHVTRTLRTAIDRGAVHHAYLFTGPRGTGKTSTARLIAKALNCVNGPTGSPCGACEICTDIAAGSCMDVVEMDAASEAGVDDVRDNIVDVIQYKPVQCRYKVFIIDEVHDLSTKAFDALLKTIEEPPSHIVFVLATTELHKVPPTIQSRCQRYSFNRANLQELRQRLEFVIEQEGREYEPGAVTAIARMADGGFRDALSLLEQVITTREGTITEEHVYEQLGMIRDQVLDRLGLALIEKNHAEVLAVIEECYRRGLDARALLEGMLQRLAELTKAIYPGGEVALDPAAEAQLRAIAAQFGPESLLRLRSACAHWLKEVRDVSLPRLWLESVMLGYGHAAPVTAPVPAPVAAPRPAPVQAPQTAVVESPAPPPKPAPVAAKPATSNPAENAWNEAVAHISSQSRAAAARLAQTSFISAEGGNLKIAFRRESDRDWVQEKKGVIPMLIEEFSKRHEGKWNLITEVEALDPGSAPMRVETAVELPAEGSKLERIVREKFENF